MIVIILMSEQMVWSVIIAAVFARAAIGVANFVANLANRFIVPKEDEK